MRQPLITIRVNKDVDNIKCEKDGTEHLVSFKQGETFVCENSLGEVLENKQYVASNNEWSKIYLPVDVCDQLLIKIPNTF